MKTNLITIFAIGLLASAVSVTCKNATPGDEKNPNETLVADNATNPCFLLLSDIHLNTFSDSTNYGDDTGNDLWKCFLVKVESILAGPNPPKFVLYTGDLPAHYSCDSSCYLPPNERDSHNKNITVILSGLRALVSKYHIPLCYAPGNNDGLAGDYYSFADEHHLTPLSLIPESNNPYPALNMNPVGAAVPCMVSNPNPSMGYYAARPISGLRIIALNSVILNKKFEAVDGTTQLNDGNTQINWLAAQLKEAAHMGEKVYIIMHVPPGIDAYKYDKNPKKASMWVQMPTREKSWLNTFLGLTDKYQYTISGILYGHTHMDELRRLYDSSGTHITEVAISCPGVTPQHYNNPGFKTIQYDSGNKEQMNFTTYYTTPDVTNWGNKSYQFSDIFNNQAGTSIYHCLSSMSMDSVNSKLNRIYTVMNGPAGFDLNAGIEVKRGQ